MKIWNISTKVPDLDAEAAFIRALGGGLIVDEMLALAGAPLRVVLMRWADKYMHLFEHAVYEHRLPSALPHGLCHVVLEAQQLQPLRQQALAAGAVEIMPFAEVDAALGTREGAFLRSPGGGAVRAGLNS